MKEFKIYRWVGLELATSSEKFDDADIDGAQNPDTPTEKPKLQSYKIDLSQSGPMMLDALVSRATWPHLIPLRQPPEASYHWPMPLCRAAHSSSYLSMDA